MSPLSSAATQATLPEWIQWVSALGPATTLVIGIVAGWVAIATLRQRRRADDKAEWWRRTQWALEQVLSGQDEREAVGVSMLGLLAKSELATQEDLDLYQAAWDDVLDEVPVQDSGDVRYVVDERSTDHDPDG